MATFDSALNRLEDRMATLNAHITPVLESKATAIYSRIMRLASATTWASNGKPNISRGTKNRTCAVMNSSIFAVTSTTSILT